MKHIKCAQCRHNRTSHYDPLTQSAKDVYCRAIDLITGKRLNCRCNLTRGEVLAKDEEK